MTTNNRHNFKLTCLIYLFFAGLVISPFTTYEGDSIFDDDFDDDDLLMQSLYFKDSEISYRGSKAVYQNEFVVYVPSGMGMANEIAEKHGFNNMGQVGLITKRAIFFKIILFVKILQGSGKGQTIASLILKF